LTLLNGLPSTGKSTQARLYAQRHPLTLALEVDLLRSMLGGWQDQPTEAGLIARSLAIAAARVELLAGRDVIVPQYLGRIEFVLELEELARHTRAGFVEIALMCGPDDVAGRFQRRSARPQTAAHVDAAELLARSGGPAELRAMLTRLDDVLSRRPRTVRIQSVEGEIEDTYAAVRAAIETAQS